MVNVWTFLKYLPIIEPNIGESYFGKAANKSEGKVASNSFQQFKKNSDWSRTDLNSLNNLKWKVKGQKSQNMANFIALSGIATSF